MYVYPTKHGHEYTIANTDVDIKECHSCSEPNVLSAQV